MTIDRFYGFITGVGSTSGVRVVVGDWRTTPLGTFADVMVEDDAGHRVLLAPSPQVAAFIAETYTFDEVLLTPVTVRLSGPALLITAEGLTLEVALGRRTPLGWLLRCVPPALAAQPAWSRAIDPLARVVLRGVRTAGRARPGRREYYGAVDVRRVTSLGGSWRGRSLGDLRPVTPPVRFGFGSTPARPSQTTVVTTVVTDAHFGGNSRT